MVRKGEFPTRQNCDPSDPEEAFLWMFVALPHVKGAPLIMPIEYYRAVSKRLWELGCRPTEEPIWEWVAPQATDPNWLTSAGKWVPAGTRAKRSEHDEARDAIAPMSVQQKTELLKTLKRVAAGDALPDSPSGRVVATLNSRQREVVLEVLEGLRGA